MAEYWQAGEAILQIGLCCFAADCGAAEPLLGVPLPSHGGVPHLHVAGRHRGVPLIGLVSLAVGHWLATLCLDVEGVSPLALVRIPVVNIELLAGHLHLLAVRQLEEHGAPHSSLV